MTQFVLPEESPSPAVEFVRTGRSQSSRPSVSHPPKRFHPASARPSLRDEQANRQVEGMVVRCPACREELVGVVSASFVGFACQCTRRGNVNLERVAGEEGGGDDR